MVTPVGTPVVASTGLIKTYAQMTALRDVEDRRMQVWKTPDVPKKREIVIKGQDPNTNVMTAVKDRLSSDIVGKDGVKGIRRYAGGTLVVECRDEEQWTKVGERLKGDVMIAESK